MLKSWATFPRRTLSGAVVLAGFSVIASATTVSAQAVQPAGRIIAPTHLDATLSSPGAAVETLSVAVPDGSARHMFFSPPSPDSGVRTETPQPDNVRAAWVLIGAALKEHAARAATGAPPQPFTPELQSALKLAADFQILEKSEIRKAELKESLARTEEQLAEIDALIARNTARAAVGFSSPEMQERFASSADNLKKNRDSALGLKAALTETLKVTDQRTKAQLVQRGASF
jgi:hypothetical protein